jgi:hypothetical protein
MMRASTLVWAGLVVLAGLFLYQVKHDVQALEDRLAGLNRRILATQDRIHVLRAEWSLLNEPARLGDLARRHLALAPMRPDQFAVPAEIAARVALRRPAAPETPAPAPAGPALAIAEAAPALPLPLPPPFPADPPRAVAARPVPSPAAAPPQAPAMPAAVPARPAPPPIPRPAPVEIAAPVPAAPPGVRTAALPRPVAAAVAAPPVSALGAPTAALPPPVPRPAGGPR